MKKLLMIAVSLILTACGANVHNTTGIDNEQYIVVIADSLIGKQISIGDIKQHTISAADLQPFEMGIAGVTDPALENSDVLKVKVDQGSNQITITQDNNVLLSKELYLSAGQTRTIKL
ncbi:hypothetical protein [Shewanella sp. NIFS-20-20]|uniref:hypothetical protein n=1 Tax=Shewanella sp. NIFS-20-20 TaxID=2853806 RepID=UPI001C482C96|nr:hypothetical protein [Shewanella sp. NIFS-20-20]MBV7316546.1 hypothetical protein [Shewanella sp. NIFS-20-20]